MNWNFLVLRKGLQVTFWKVRKVTFISCESNMPLERKTGSRFEWFLKYYDLWYDLFISLKSSDFVVDKVEGLQMFDVGLSKGKFVDGISESWVLTWKFCTGWLEPPLVQWFSYRVISSLTILVSSGRTRQSNNYEWLMFKVNVGKYSSPMDRSWVVCSFLHNSISSLSSHPDACSLWVEGVKVRGIHRLNWSIQT